MTSKVTNVWILGGSFSRPDEFNFGQDAPAAARVVEVLAEKIHLVPGDASSHHLVPDDFIPAVVQAAGRQATDTSLLAQIVEEEQQYSIFYDPVCVFLYLHPDAARFRRQPLHVDPESGVTSSGPATSPAITIAEQVDFAAYQSWLLQAIHLSDPTRTEAQRSKE